MFPLLQEDPFCKIHSVFIQFYAADGFYTAHARQLLYYLHRPVLICRLDWSIIRFLCPAFYKPDAAAGPLVLPAARVSSAGEEGAAAVVPEAAVVSLAGPSVV